MHPNAIEPDSTEPANPSGLPHKRERSKRGAHKSQITQPTPGKQLIEILGRKLVVWLSIGSLIGAVTLCVLCIFYPILAVNQSARFFICLLSAFFFAVFVFTLFPTDYKFDLGRVSIPIVLIGPAALWIALLLLFLNLLPNEQSLGRVIRPAADSPSLIYSTTWVLGWKPSPPPAYYKIETKRDQLGQQAPSLLEGIFVEFDTTHDRYIAEIGSGPSSDEIYDRYEIELNRNAATFQLHPIQNQSR